MKFAVFLFLFVVGACAIEKNVSKKQRGLPHRTQLINKLKLVVDDAGAPFNEKEVANITDQIKKGLAKIQEKKHLPSLGPLVTDLESSILALPDTNPRGPAFKAVADKADEIRNVLSTVLSDLERIPYDIENRNLHLLGKNEQTNQIRKNLHKFGAKFGGLLKLVNHYYNKWAKNHISIDAEVQELVDLLSRPSVSRQQYQAAIKKIRRVGPGPKLHTMKQHKLTTKK